MGPGPGMGGGAGFGPPAPYGGPGPQYGGNKPTFAPSYGASGPTSSGAQHRGGDDDNKLAKVRDPLLAVSRWIKLRSPKEKMGLGALAGVVVSPGPINRPAGRALGP